MGRYNFNDTIDQHHKILNPIHKEGGKHIEPRLLDDSAYGSTCPHSCDGDQCGLVRYEAIFNHMSLGVDPDTVIHLLLKSPFMKAYEQLDIRGMVQEMENSGDYLTPENGFRILPPSSSDSVSSSSDAVTTSSSSTSSSAKTSSSKSSSRNSRSSSRSPTRKGKNDVKEELNNFEVKEELPKLNSKEESTKSSFNFVHVMVNQNFIGIAPNAQVVMDAVRTWRHQMVISVDTSVSRGIRKGQHIVDIRTEVGRNLRPLYVLRNLYKLETMDLDYCRWEHLLCENIVEFIDVQEQTEILIASDFKDAEASVAEWSEKHPGEPYPFDIDQDTFTHCELHGCAVYGLSAQFIPFSNFNAAVRNTFQVGQGRQAQGMHSTNARKRFDTTITEMWYALIYTYILNCTIF